MEHRCSKCGVVKPVAEFPRRSNGRPQCYCYPCWNVYHHQRYLKSKAAFVARAKDGIRRNIARRKQRAKEAAEGLVDSQEVHQGAALAQG